MSYKYMTGMGAETENATPSTNGAVTNGAAPANGNGAAATAVVPAEEEKKYLGFTAMELALGAAGFGALYFLVLKK